MSVNFLFNQSYSGNDRLPETSFGTDHLSDFEKQILIQPNLINTDMV